MVAKKQQTHIPEGKGRTQYRQRDEQFVKMYSDLVDLPISDGAKVTYIKLLEYDFKYPHVFPGYETLSKERQGRSVASIKRDIQEVEELGLVVVINTGRSNYYVIWNWLPANGQELAQRRVEAMADYNAYKEEKRKARKSEQDNEDEQSDDSSSVSYRTIAHTRAIRKLTHAPSDSSPVSQEYKSIDNKIEDTNTTTTATAVGVVGDELPEDTNQQHDKRHSAKGNTPREVAGKPNGNSIPPQETPTTGEDAPQTEVKSNTGRSGGRRAAKAVPVVNDPAVLAVRPLEERRWIQAMGLPYDYVFTPAMLHTFEVWRMSLGADDELINYAFDAMELKKAQYKPDQKQPNWCTYVDTTIRNRVGQRYTPISTHIAEPTKRDTPDTSMYAEIIPTKRKVRQSLLVASQPH